MTAASLGDGQPAPRTVAAFDFDGTITRGGSVFPFLISARGLLPVLAAVVRTSPSLVRGAVAGGSAADRGKERLFVRLLSGVPAAHLDRQGRAFAEHHLRRHLRPEMRDRMAWHRRQGHLVVIVSASPECYVRPAGELLGVDGVLATRLAVEGSGRVTGRYDGKNCRGAEKYARVVGWLRAEGLAGAGAPQPVLWAYGNSRGDLRLLEGADHPVNAGLLGRFGRLGRFPSLAAVVADAPSTASPTTGPPERHPPAPRPSRSAP
ncbi:MAG TPA: HAD-IB family hydrolase [Acidimicrobiales bacterium]|nr:HAD-IB family hydrolase [Acidimicrobiales bacterium]